MPSLVEKEKKSNISPEEYWAEFKKIIEYIEEAMGREFSETRVAIYLDHLQKYSIEDIWDGVKVAIQEEAYSQIPPVGKIISFIREAREERGDRWPRLELKEERPNMTPERVRELLQPFYNRLAEHEKESKESKERGEILWKTKKENLSKQVPLVKRSADPVGKGG